MQVRICFHLICSQRSFCSPHDCTNIYFPYIYIHIFTTVAPISFVLHYHDPMNVDEKLQQSRNRNREHAKNTRLRKKAYVLKLKALVERIARQKEIEESERHALGVRIYETHNIRKQVVHTYFNYRAANERSHMKWSDILDESFSLIIPITPYRSFHKGDIVNNTRTVKGINGAISESASLSLLAQSVGLGSQKWINAIKQGLGCYIVHKYKHDDIVISGDQFICHFSIHIEDAESIGSGHRCVQSAMLYGRFNSQHKLTRAEIIFDVMGFMQQLQKVSCLSPQASIVPNTIDMALTPSTEPRAVMLAEAPYKIVYVSKDWTKQSKVSQSFIEGKPFCQELGISTPQYETVTQMVADCALCRPGSAVIMTQHINDNNMKEPVLLYLRLFPLTGDVNGVPKTTHMMAVLTNLPLQPEEAESITNYLENEPIVSA
jgi:hypothetical protein